MIYLDCNATTPVEPEVSDLAIHFLREEFGNAGSRTHEFGLRAKRAVDHAREQIAAVVKANPMEVIFTSGATESNNIAILGLEEYANQNGYKHLITTGIEHKAVLEPLEHLSKKGFDITYLKPGTTGRISSDGLKTALREDTCLVSVMHVNNETGVIQPIEEIAGVLEGHPAYFHVDAAQGFGKEISPLQNKRIDLISISGHKIYAPKGIGALITRRRGHLRSPIQPLMFGGGQERKLRPGTLPVHLIASLGLAAELALNNHRDRNQICEVFKQATLEALLSLHPVINGDLEKSLPNALNLSFVGIDSEALMLTLKDEIAISNGSACTSHSYQPSHVLKSMGMSDELIQSAVRISWCHMSAAPDWNKVVAKIKNLL